MTKPDARASAADAAAPQVRSGAQAINRALSLLMLVGESDRPLTMTQLAAEAGLTVSTASRIVNALLDRDMIARDGHGFIYPGMALVRLSHRRSIYSGLIAAATPSLGHLSRATGEMATLAVLDGAGVDHLAQIDGVHLVGATNWVGRRAPLHCSSTGKVFLAFGLAEPDPRLLVPHAVGTITDASVLNEELEEVRRLGYAVATDELEDGLTAVATPVYDANSTVVAALSVSGPTDRLTNLSIVRIAHLLDAASDDVRSRLTDSPRLA